MLQGQTPESPQTFNRSSNIRTLPFASNPMRARSFPALAAHDLGIVWCAPWRVNVGGVLKAKDNKLEIDVVNTWVNRIIGDEQEPLDVEMVKVDDPRKGGYAAGLCGTGLKDLPDWLIKGEPRPSKGRYTFVNWQFYTKDAPLLESGLMGPVQIVSRPRVL